MTREEELIYTALCDRLRSPEHGWQSMSLTELETATGLATEPLAHAHRALRGPDGHDESRILYGAGRVVLGAVWRGRCRDLPDDPGPDRS